MTVADMVSAEAPGYATDTFTVGGTSSGYCAIGNAVIANAPTSVMTIDITADRIGLRRNRLGLADMAMTAIYLPSGA